MKTDLTSNPVTSTMLAQLPFIGEAMPIIAYPKDKVKLYNMYVVTDEDLPKIQNLLKGGDMPNLPKKSKVYVLPNCIYTQVQIREICRMHGFTITNDLSKANLFVGNTRSVLHQIGGEPAETLATKELRLKHFHIASDFDGLTLLSKFPQFPDLDVSTDKDVFFTNGYYNRKDSWGPLYATDNTYNVISGDGVAVLHRILSGNIPVVNEERLFNSIERVVIDEDIYNTLHIMLEAGTEDRILATEMLFNCDYNKSRYYIVKLIQEDSYRIEAYMNRKNLDIFRNHFPISKIARFNYKETLKYLLNYKCLTEDIYMDVLYTSMSMQKTQFENQFESLRDFFAVDLMVIKPYQDYINENTPKNEENKSTDAESQPAC